MYGSHAPTVAAMGVPVSTTALIAASWWVFAIITMFFVLVSFYQLLRPKPDVLP